MNKISIVTALGLFILNVGLSFSKEEVVRLSSLENCFSLDLHKIVSKTQIHGAFGPIDGPGLTTPELILGYKPQNQPDERRFPIHLCISAALLTLKDGLPSEINLNFIGLDPPNRFTTHFFVGTSENSTLNLENVGRDQILTGSLPVIIHHTYHPSHAVWVMKSILHFTTSLTEKQEDPKLWAEVRKEPLVHVPQTSSEITKAPYIVDSVASNK